MKERILEFAQFFKPFTRFEFWTVLVLVATFGLMIEYSISFDAKRTNDLYSSQEFIQAQ